MTINVPTALRVASLVVLGSAAIGHAVVFETLTIGAALFVASIVWVDFVKPSEPKA